MTKAQEIKILRDAADRLDKNTYCGPWLREQISYIEDNLRSDYFPAISYNDCVGSCARLEEATQAECEQRRESARKEAARIKKEAQDFADQVRMRAVRQLREALQLLDND